MTCSRCVNCTVACQKGHLECLKTIISNKGFSWGPEHREACVEASLYGHLECLRYADEKGCRLDSFSYFKLQGYEFEANSLHMAIMGRHIDCLRYLIRKGCHWHSHTHILLAIKGFLEGMKEMYRPDDDWSDDTIGMCARNGHLECLKYAVEHRAVSSPISISEDEEIWNLLPDELAACYGHTECLDYLTREYNDIKDEKTFPRKKRLGYITIRYDDIRGEKAIPRAVKNGHTGCVRILIERGYSYAIDDKWSSVISFSTLEDFWWRTFLFTKANLGNAPKIRKMIRRKKQEIQDSLQVIQDTTPVSRDIVKYVIGLYL